MGLPFEGKIIPFWLFSFHLIGNGRLYLPGYQLGDHPNLLVILLDRVPLFPGGKTETKGPGNHQDDKPENRQRNDHLDQGEP